LNFVFLNEYFEPLKGGFGAKKHGQPRVRKNDRFVEPVCCVRLNTAWLDLLPGLFLKNVAKIVKLWKAQSRCTGIEDRQSQLKKPKADQNKQTKHNKK